MAPLREMEVLAPTGSLRLGRLRSFTLKPKHDMQRGLSGATSCFERMVVQNVFFMRQGVRSVHGLWSSVVVSYTLSAPLASHFTRSQSAASAQWNHYY